MLEQNPSSLAAEYAQLRVQEFLQALYIIADECGMELVDAAVQLGADPAHLQGVPASPLLTFVTLQRCDTVTPQQCDVATMCHSNSVVLQYCDTASMWHCNDVM